ncbi:S-locus lectin protein kinase family protein [Actinidia rufa]|uniref:S-locus lectin protein kinase family protein n=1 Tax=Actinidia rufa TaxID=165716 RepID=A0A7J0DS35_9ERIC|nr:S-locus lectin protein kinase family protein [Actinidia rufa]
MEPLNWASSHQVGYNKLRNEKQVLTSWRSSEDPALSLFSLELQPNSSNILLWNGSKLYWTTELWDGKGFSLVLEKALAHYIKNVTYVSNENESYFTYESRIPTALTRLVLDVTGQLKQFVWEKDFPTWSLFWAKPPQQCEVYAFCGPFSSCTQDVPICTCIEGFEPRTLADWELGDHSDGRVRKIPLECDNGGNDTFVLVTNIRFPVNSEALTVGNIDECQLVCLRNCSCTAYAYNNGCLIWGSALLNVQKLPVDDMSGRDLHVRVATSELEATRPKAKRRETLWRARDATLKEVEDSLVVFKFRDIRNATKNFSEKLGEGGFGSVFMGTLPNSTLVAVKLPKSLEQGEKQFCAEVSTIGMIQHINLVHLHGFCKEGTQRFLVYDYMPNGSLESHLFNKDSNVLDWKKRYKLPIGIARALAYLHEKCRDCIVHCDMKPDNILLDGEYNPKVVDFGLAKLLRRDFSRILTTVRGTRGYLAPEWISGEAITSKADVFSYGMVLFEIISGRRNIDIVNDEMVEYFAYRVASKINEGKEVLVTLLDTKLEGNAGVEELTRACKVACWCIQDDEKDRPTMGQVVQVLEGFIEVDAPPIP